MDTITITFSIEKGRKWLANTSVHLRQPNTKNIFICLPTKRRNMGLKKCVKITLKKAFQSPMLKMVIWCMNLRMEPSNI